MAELGSHRTTERVRLATLRLGPWATLPSAGCGGTGGKADDRGESWRDDRDLDAEPGASVERLGQLDLWVQAWRERRARGEVLIVRYADDFVMGFQYRDDAERLLAELRERFARFGLELNDAKTRLIEFGRFAATNRQERGERRPETFDFLGFTHLCGTRRSDGRFTVHRQTSAKRLRAKAKEVRQTLLRHRAAPIRKQGSWLRSVVRGFFNYHAVPGNGRALDAFRTLIQKAWLRALRRRSQKGMRLTWERMKPLFRTWLPSVRILHPYPNVRFRVNHPR
jgi:hypothetical protein